jgi:glycine/D-amino acid oxidase-like deaminating enzyme
MDKLDYIIVGQGLVGTLIAFRLLKLGKNIRVVDNHHKHAASKVAAGIINPVTGKKYIKSWQIDKLIPEARVVYRALGNLLNKSYVTKRNVLRVIPDIKSENHWEGRKTDPFYDPYIVKETSQDPYPEHLHKKKGWGEITNSLHVHLPKLIADFSNFLRSKGLLVEEDFDYAALYQKDNRWSYKELDTSKVIFCEGYKAHRQNPYFSYLPFQPVKGEAVMIELTDCKIDKMLKDKEFLVPVEDNLYWSGGGYNWTDLDEEPTDGFYVKWQKHIAELLKVDYVKKERKAGVRPSVIDRRPMIGCHPEYEGLVICNGMGTKGTSLAPYCTAMLLRHIEEEKDIDSEIHVKRFEHLYKQAEV